MKQFIALVLLLPLAAAAQIKIAVKGGLNFTNVSKAPSNTSMKTGYMFGGYVSSKPKLIGFRSEIILSRQGYDYKINTNSGTVNLDYLLLPQLLTANFTRKVQFHAGLHLAYLLNAKVDSSGNNSSGNLFSYFNRFDYGYAVGIEIFPFAGFFIGSRAIGSFKDIYESPPLNGNQPPNFTPNTNLKNKLVQLYIGWRL